MVVEMFSEEKGVAAGGGKVFKPLSEGLIPFINAMIKKKQWQ